MLCSGGFCSSAAESLYVQARHGSTDQRKVQGDVWGIRRQRSRHLPGIEIPCAVPTAVRFELTLVHHASAVFLVVAWLTGRRGSQIMRRRACAAYAGDLPYRVGAALLAAACGPPRQRKRFVSGVHLLPWRCPVSRHHSVLCRPWAEAFLP